ncbi:hypothetical protein PUNSTDRAFT_128778 [Punctularia strigosozonata HHB-11173 SS5]|uniref:uncharacterized protein n=1 Tax=Punctularia strigosozonata (strain HHB-11173) TaxID=741275 RepID=UPI0004417867|nr:uncharacterized protein PUNSTDRAFT_128778 [Punctularia strigosozonata HHB-11173 SS5]EIN13096.1 hypothetical protein PUNSTDRAFT_128778 [Punctularia strigosozonata HHB-11173 SS5]
MEHEPMDISDPEANELDELDELVDVGPRFDPESILKAGKAMAQQLEVMTERWNLSPERATIWKAALHSISEFTLPTTSIAVYGRTGDGKSTLLNALVGLDIFPSSATGKAATGAPIVISYHDSPMIYCDIQFLAESAWKDQLSQYRTDILDGVPINDDVRKLTWNKIKEIYPGLSDKDILKMTPDENISYDPSVGLDKVVFVCTKADMCSNDTDLPDHSKESQLWLELSTDRERMVSQRAQKQAELNRLSNVGKERKKSEGLSEAFEQLQSTVKELQRIESLLADNDKQMRRFCTAERSKDIVMSLNERIAEILDRNEASICMPRVYCCAARHSILSSGTHAPNVYKEMDETGIPAIRQWCQNLGLAACIKAVIEFIEQLDILVVDVQRYLDNSLVGDASYRAALQEEWQSTSHVEIMNHMKALAEAEVETLKKRFRRYLNESCTIGIEKASDAALRTAEDLCDSGLHHNTVRATFRHNGVFRENWNYKLLIPFQDAIMPQWNSLFARRMFDALEANVAKGIKKIIKQMAPKTSLTAGPLKRQFSKQRKKCEKNVRKSMNIALRQWESAFQKDRKDLHSSMHEWIQTRLEDVYQEAASKKGPGSSKISKILFRDFIGESKRDIFIDLGKHVFNSLDRTADKVQAIMTRRLCAVADQCTLDMALLWDRPTENIDYTQDRVDLAAMREELKKYHSLAEERRYDMLMNGVEMEGEGVIAKTEQGVAVKMEKGLMSKTEEVIIGTPEERGFMKQEHP